MHVLLWILQALLAAAFLAHGLMFLFPSPEILAQMNASMPRWLGLFLGVCEVLASIGLILPGLLHIQPWLVWLAAAGLIPIMAGAVVLHVWRGETSSAVTTFVLLALATTVAHGRRRVRPIAPR